MRLTTLALAILAAMAVTLPATADDAPRAKPGDLDMTLSVAGPGTVTAYEPVVLRESLENATDHVVTQQIQPDYTTRIEIRGADGKLAAQTPLLNIPGDFLVGIRRYAPGQTHTSYLVISAIYSFKDAAKYTITVSEGMTQGGCLKSTQKNVWAEIQTSWESENRREAISRPFWDGVLSTDSGVPSFETASQDHKAGFDSIAEGSVMLIVRPFDQKALDARLKLLFGPVLAANGGLPNDADGMSSSAILEAMESVRHDSIIPYLVQTAEFGADWPKYAARALYRIGTPKAQQALKKLTERKDDAGQKARYGLSFDLAVSAYDWHVE